eukprot:CAMPEP_0198737256 /NCGR_PEP_ID=MMETSP1475-20131203/67773_1 /TAXON_ID= ORGANISM="Unidentified sp., Strain CCMP1999" /NCGR_SAMPLE_ID=MMETSP1475 /ASSEMBLY_ACC=CAM_ASM_001111 /LENGTH=311 /DNA_ID=CAMNT_0044501115 /DNA_START=44 /DNA_END=980 /DNA_ORIENTATION=-
MAASVADHYAVLGLKPGASEKEVTSAYRKAALRWHPDKNPGNESARDMFAKVYTAYEVLTDSELREKYEKEKKAETYHAERTKEMDATRKRMKEDLEKKEKQASEDEANARKRKQRTEVSAEMRSRMKEEIERLRKEFEREEREQKTVAKKSKWTRGPSPVLIKWTSRQTFDEAALLRELKVYERDPSLIMTKRGALVTFKSWEAQQRLFADRQVLSSRGLKIKGDEDVFFETSAVVHVYAYTPPLLLFAQLFADRQVLSSRGLKIKGDEDEMEEKITSQAQVPEQPEFGRYEEDTLAMMFGNSEKKAKPG